MACAQGWTQILVDVEPKAVAALNLLPLWEKDTETCELAR